MLPKKENLKLLGRKGEDFACWYLEKIGYKILERNYTSKLGEIDLIAQEKDTLVFVEVKTRKSYKFGHPEEAVNVHKLKKIKRVGELFALTHRLSIKRMRVDVVSITTGETFAPIVKLIKNA